MFQVLNFSPPEHISFTPGRGGGLARKVASYKKNIEGYYDPTRRHLDFKYF